MAQHTSECTTFLRGPVVYTAPLLFSDSEQKMRSKASAIFNLLPQARMASGARVLALHLNVRAGAIAILLRLRCGTRLVSAKAAGLITCRPLPQPFSPLRYELCSDAWLLASAPVVLWLKALLPCAAAAS